MNKVYLVMYAEYEWDTHQIASIWDSEEKADEEREKLHASLEKLPQLRWVSTYVEDWEVNQAAIIDV